MTPFVLFSASPWRTTKYSFCGLLYFFKSAREPTITVSIFGVAAASSFVLQTGNGAPQKRDREIAHSFEPKSQFPKRPSPTSFGIQLTFLFSETSLFVISGTFTN